MSSTCMQVIAHFLGAISTISTVIIGILLLIPESTSMGTNTAAGVTLVVISMFGIVHIVVGGLFIAIVECFSCMMSQNDTSEPLTPA